MDEKMSRRLSNLALRNPAIAVFIGIWASYFLLLLIMPFRSIYPDILEAVLLEILFVGLVYVGYALTFRTTPTTEPATHGETGTLVAVALLFAAIGLVSAVIDKVFIAGIDYSDGLALARERMANIGKDRVGISSIFSVLGHALGSSYFVAVAAVLVRPASKKTIALVLSISAAFLIAGGIISAGRSTVMLALAFISAFLCIRALVGLPLRLPKGRALVAIAAFLSVAGAFIIYMFAARAAAHNLNGIEYIKALLPFLGADLTLSDHWTGVGLFQSFIGFVVAAAAYFIHSAYTLAGIISLPHQDSHILLGFEMQLLAKLGIVPPPNTNWVLAGRFPSLPGGLYHDIGLIGLCAGGLIIGAGTAIAGRTIKRFSASMVLTGAAACVFVILFLSPLILAADVLAFPFIVFAFVLVPSVAGIVRLCRRSQLGVPRTEKR